MRIISSFLFLYVYCNNHYILSCCLLVTEYIHKIELNLVKII